MANLWSYLFRPEQGEERVAVRKFPPGPKFNSCNGLEEQWVLVKDEEREKEEGVLQFIPTIPKIPVESFGRPMTRAGSVERLIVPTQTVRQQENIPRVVEGCLVQEEPKKIQVAGEEIDTYEHFQFEPVIDAEDEMEITAETADKSKPVAEIAKLEEVKQESKEAPLVEEIVVNSPAVNTHVAHLLMERDSMTNCSTQSARNKEIRNDKPITHEKAHHRASSRRET